MRKRRRNLCFQEPAWRYSELLADEGDWVEIYNRLLVDNHFRVLAIIVVEMKLEFVVYANEHFYWNVLLV
ncbi:MAG: hypothetical protein ACLTAF_02525 [Blautia coccoides]